MSATPLTTQDVADRVQDALRAADLAEFARLLDPQVRWGAPNDPAPACQNREQVLQWYQRGRDAGVQGTVTELVVSGDRILVGMDVTGSPAAQEGGGSTRRWQVLEVRGGKVTEIVGYDNRDEAAARAGVTS